MNKSTDQIKNNQTEDQNSPRMIYKDGKPYEGRFVSKSGKTDIVYKDGRPYDGKIYSSDVTRHGSWRGYCATVRETTKVYEKGKYANKIIRAYDGYLEEHHEYDRSKELRKEQRENPEKFAKRAGLSPLQARLMGASKILPGAVGEKLKKAVAYNVAGEKPVQSVIKALASKKDR